MNQPTVSPNPQASTSPASTQPVPGSSPSTKLPGVNVLLMGPAGTGKTHSIGTLVVHSGHQLHQIAGTKDGRPGDARITLQAHALRVDGEWVMYW